MFKNKIAISKNFLIAICFISLILFAVTSVDAIELNESYPDEIGLGADGNYNLNAIDEDKLGNSQENILSLPKTIQLTNGNFSDIQNAIHYSLENGDTLDLEGNFIADGPDSYIFVYKNISVVSRNGATLDGKNISSAFIVQTGGSGSSFSNLIFKNGNHSSGGAVLVYGKDVTFDDCEFMDNYASRGGGAIYTDYIIEQNPDAGRNLLIRNSKFINNFATITAGAVGAYGFNVRILNCTFDSNRVYDKNGGAVYGGALQVGRQEFISNTLIKDCKFINNRAISVSGTQLAHGGASCIRDGVSYENCLFEGNSADFGGALTAHCSGTIKNCTFISNSANDYGGAITNSEEINSMNLKIIDCKFDSNTAPYGGAAKLAGYSVTVEDCSFDNNNASIDGGALYIITHTLDVFDSNFTQNNAYHNGGAIYVNGESTTVQGSKFTSNEAIANPMVNDDGLGGAIYINGSSDNVKNNIFEYNVARNGSAIYYDESGSDLLVTNNVMTENQAWVYALPVYANDIYYGENEEIGAIIFGGNNIAKYNYLPVSNAIYNAALNRNIKVDGQTPVSGATNSGELYQDAREYNIDVLLTVKHSDGTVVYNNTLKSSYLGEVNDVLADLKPGTYTLTATHFEDNYYKAITNQTTFVVTPKVDVGVKKTSSDEQFNYHDLVVWTLTVTNNGPNDATGVNVSDVLPSGLLLRSAVASHGSYSGGVWNIGDLAKGASATLKITTLINKTGDITNKANITANEFDWNITNNQDSQKITVNDATDLAITKTANVTNPNYGDLVKWTLTVKNNGPDRATGVVVTDVMPDALIVINPPRNYVSGKWSVGSLDVGKSATLEIITKVNATGSIKNTASVNGSQYDYNPSNNKASETINVVKAADLSVVKSVNNTSPDFGDLIRWTVTVRNNGPDDATDVNVTDVLPSDLLLKSSSASSGRYSDGVWTIGNLAKGGSATLTVVTEITKTGTIKNVVSVEGNEFDINESNNHADASVNVAKAADLAVVKSVNNTAPNFGDLVKWTVTVRNNGPDAATGVNVSDALPAGLILQSHSVSVGSYSKGVWTIGNLANGGSATLSIVALVNKTGSIKNTASVKGNEFDINPSNNNASKSINVEKAADLAVSKSVNNSIPNFNDLVKWTVVVKNNGPDDATGVNVSDVLPSGLVLDSYSVSAGSYAGGVWTIGNLAKGGSATLNIVTRINKTGTIINAADVKGNEFDINMANNHAEDSVNVAEAADLSVVKSVNNTSPNFGDLVKWTIVVKNNGPDVAHDIVLKDMLPSGLIVTDTTGNYNNGRWTIGSLNVGKSVSFEITTLVNKTGVIINNVSVIGREHDYNPSNNNASKGIDVAKSADLAVVKSVNNTAPNFGDLIRWTVTVSNIGPDDATGVNVSDILPSGLVLDSYSVSVGSYSNGVWTIGNLAKGGSATLNIVTRINKTGTIENVVVVKGNEYDIDMSNNNASKSVIVPDSADLEIIKNVNNSSPNYLDLVKWTVTVKNNGPDTAHNVVITDMLPSGLIIKSGTDRWKIDSLAYGESETFEIVTLVNKTGLLTNKVSVTGREYDYNPSNNNASKSINVPKAADLIVIKEVNNTSPNFKDLIRWTVMVRNNGPDDATGVNVSDVLPSGLVLDSCDASVGSYSDGVWTIGDLANGESSTLNIVTRVNKTGIIVNKVDVSANEYDYDVGNNNASKSVSVPKAADLEVTKTVNNSTPNYHDLIKWTIVVRNNGPDNASGVFVDDIMPEGLIIQSVNGNYSNGKWNVGSLNAFSSKTLEIVTFVNKTGTFINNVNVSGEEYDYNKSNNRANSSINVPLASDLEIVKLVSNPNPNYGENIKWIIIVKNNGPDNASGVRVNEALPEAFELIRATESKGHYINDIWFIGDLSVGEVVNLEIITKVNKTGNFTNVVDVTANEYDYNSSNSEDNKSVIVNPCADLEISKVSNVSSPNYNDLVKWTITVKNNGPDKANEIEILDILPKGLEFVDYVASKGYYSDGYWKFCCLEVGEIQTLNLTTRVKSIGEIKNIATANAKEHDFNPDNNRDESSVSVDLACDLEITKLVNQTKANYKDLVEWTLIVKNNGPSDASEVFVIESLPEGLTFIRAQGDGSYSTTGTWYIGDLGSQKTVQLTIICRVDKTGEFTNIASVKGAQYDYNQNNNRAEKSISVSPAADLSIIKTVSKVQYDVGDLISYSIEITNNGPDTARNISVREFMDDSLLFKSAFAASGDYDDASHVWHIKSLANGEKTSLHLNAVAAKEGLANNRVSASSDTFDFNLNNNYVECVVDIIKNILVPDNIFDYGLYHEFKENEFVHDGLDMVSKAGVEMKETGIPIGLLMVISLISLAFCGSNILKKR